VLRVRRNICGVVLLGTLALVGTGPAEASPVATTARTGPVQAGLWKCWWAPTMDNDWHNDALCSNGARQVRPYLRPKDTFITRDELMASARAWARARNTAR